MAKSNLIPASFLMKGQFSRFFASLFLIMACFILVIPASRAVPYVGNLTFTSQTQINAFSSIYTSVTGNLTITGSSINNLTPLHNLTAVGGYFYVRYNPALTNLNGLSSITSVGGDFMIENNVALANLDGLNSLTSVGGNFSIGQNNVLPNLDGLSSFTSVGGGFRIENNAALTNLNGLSSLTSVWSLGIYNNDALTSLNGLNAITSVEYLTINLNDGLTNLNGLNAITSVEALSISANANLTSLDGLSSITAVVEFLQIDDNDALTNLDGLSGITSGVDYLNIFNNDALTNLDGLSSITSMGYFWIDNNAALTNLNGLSGITSVDGGFNIFSNAALTSLEGLSSITSAKFFVVFNNDALTSLNGLNGIITMEEWGAIIDNDALTDCCAIYDLLNSGNIGGIYLQDNQTGCDSEAEINTYCGDTDQDGIPNETDNCPAVANADQANNDGDAEGDACDDDDDNDGFADAGDNCPLTANAGQQDLDNDGIGDVCDPVTNMGGTVTALVADIQTLNLPQGVKNSLNAKLTNAQHSFCVNGNTTAAINQLNAFINQVEAKRGNPLANEEADDLIARANALIAAIQNGTAECGGAKPGKNDRMTLIAGQLDIELYPNPAGSEVNIQLYGLEHNGVVTIYNQLGSAVWQQPVETGAVSLKVPLVDNAFVPGVYTVSLRVENEVITRRLVVAR